jgi:hypothetical protein
MCFVYERLFRLIDRMMLLHTRCDTRDITFTQ